MTTVSIVGNVTRDPELRFGNHGGTAFARFTVAVNRRKKKGNDFEDITSYFEVLCFKEQAEHVAECIAKGTRVVVMGTLDIDEWESKDGKKGKTATITADEVAASLRFNRVDVHARATQTDAKRVSSKIAAQPDYSEEPF